MKKYRKTSTPSPPPWERDIGQCHVGEDMNWGEHVKGKRKSEVK
jgi:hypothetical protein